MPSTQILQIFKGIAPLSDEDCGQFAKIFKNKHLAKGDYWVREGSDNRLISYVEQGYLRKYYLKDGNEITDFFYFENDFCADLPSIIENSKPSASIMAMEPTTLTVFSHAELEALCSSSARIEHLYRVLVEQTFVRFYNRTVSFIMQSPKERYDQLILQRPQIQQRATQYHIASYLGISYQHLSRLRGTK